MSNSPVKEIFSIVESDGTKTDFISIDHSRSPDRCWACNKKRELRPYGPYGNWICFECGMKFEEICKNNFGKILSTPVQ